MPSVKRLLAGCLIVMLLAACNTVRGIGQDIRKGGEAIERAGNR